jgi:hypothetical protein
MESTRAQRKSSPKGLAAGGKAVWRSVIDAGYALDPAELVLLHRLCRAVDVLDRLDIELEDMGICTGGSTGQPRANPLLSEMREQVKLIDQLQRSLALPLPGESHGTRRTGEAKRLARSGRPAKHPNRMSHLTAREGGA